MEESHTPMGESIRTSCERCRRRKIRCDRKRPCSRCVKANKECILRGTGEKQRPVSKNYVTALEGQVAALEQVIRRLAVADSDERDTILSQLSLSTPKTQEEAGNKSAGKSSGDADESTLDPSVAAARLRSGQLRKVLPHQGAQFFGGTSTFQIHLSRETSTAGVPTVPVPVSVPVIEDDRCATLEFTQDTDWDLSQLLDFDEAQAPTPPLGGVFQYAPHDEVSQKMMAAFFKHQYQYYMVIYRELFLRDYDIGSGKYYSDALLYTICSLGALQNDETLQASEVFSGQAQALLFATLDSPDLTTLQALMLLGYREIAVGRTSKGWLLCGMAFRLAHEMGLHLDPTNWSSGMGGFMRDVEILRRVYWAVFIADKQLSLFFGRPPALHPSESDVRNTIRMQYPSDWQSLLQTYICSSLSATEFEDGIVLVGSFIYRAELYKIVHVMITELFENRRGREAAEPAVIATKTHQVHVSLTKWLSSLPGSLHWNQWTVGKVQPWVLHLHMVYHTVMIILHRPPSHMFDEPGMAESVDVELCYESLEAILRLLRTFSRFYQFRSLPLDFVHTLSTAAGAVMMKRYLRKATWTDPEIEKPLALLLEAMNEIQNTWTSVREIRDVVVRAQQTEGVMMPPQDMMSAAPDFMMGLQMEGPSSDIGGGLFAQPLCGDDGVGDDDIKTLITDEFLGSQLNGVGEGFSTSD